MFIFWLLLGIMIVFSVPKALAEDAPPSKELPEKEEWPKLLTLGDGTPVRSPADWAVRRQEILALYQHHVYGKLPDANRERVSYSLSETGMPNTKTLAITVSVGEKSASFSVRVTLPEGAAPCPCYIEYAFLRDKAALVSPNCQAAAARGYAGVTYVPTDAAADSRWHRGAFYQLYPYDAKIGSFPGVLAAWAWGASKIMDALEGGAGKELGIDPSQCIVAGVSRYGKSAAVAGAYDQRFRVVVPSCSGAGGVALFRTSNHGKTYDLSSLGGPKNWVNESINEPLNNLQGPLGYWFCKNFRAIRSAKALPVEQYMLCALTAAQNRFLIVVTGMTSEGWSNTEGQFHAWALSQPVWDLLDCPDNSRMIVHLDGHAILSSDLEKILDYCDVHLLGADAARYDLTGMKGEVFAKENRTVLDQLPISEQEKN